MNIAGGVSAALLHRERTGEALEVDLSLLSTAWLAAGASVTQDLEKGSHAGRSLRSVSSSGLP
jgi:crotonobetainyl-CoA:carnitine CoA-transferase CaiB-like acyl-CoA transferase